MTTVKQRKQLSKRYTHEDWGTLCTSVEFLAALKSSVEEAEVVAHEILHSNLCESN